MNCEMHRSANVLMGEVAGSADLVEWTVDRIKNWFQPSSQAKLPPAMTFMTLEQTLSYLREEFVPRDGARFRIFVTGRPKPLKPAIQQQIYLIGREALINALRHSEATSIEAEIEYLPRCLRILVRDNGRGIDSTVVTYRRHAYLGLVGMRERAAGIGAQFRIWSRLGAGTEVEISLPGRALVDAFA